MYRRLLPCAGLLALMIAAPAPARAADKPGLVLRLASLDQLRADARYLAGVVGQQKQADDLDQKIKAALGDQGMKALDASKPIGAYGTIGRMGIDSTVVVLVPVADEKAFVGMLENFDAKPEKGDDGVYTANVDKIPAPVYFRFANGYAYVTARDKDALDKNQLLDPAAVLPAGQVGTFSLTVNIDQIPDNLKELALGNVENQLANAKEQDVPNESKVEKSFRLAAIDEVGAAIKSVFTNGGETTLRMDVDRKSADLSFSLSVAGKSGTPLAAAIKGLGQVQSITAPLVGANSAMNGVLNVSLPEGLRSKLGPVIEEGEKKALGKENDPAKRQALSALLKALRPTFQTGQLDAAADLRGPDDNGLFSAVAGIKVKDGGSIEKTIRDIIGGLPEAERKAVTFDVEKAGPTAIHKIKPDKNDPETQRVFGDNPVYFAVRDDAILVALGDKGLSVLKESLTTQPKPSKVIEFQMAMQRLAPLMVKDNKAAPEVARKVFAGAKDADKLRLSLEGGQTLKLRLGMKAQMLAFFNDLQKAKSGGR